jgi:hypothetical protein
MSHRCPAQTILVLMEKLRLAWEAEKPVSHPPRRGARQHIDLTSKKCSDKAKRILNQAGHGAPVLEHLPSKLEALSSAPRTTN